MGKRSLGIEADSQDKKSEKPKGHHRKRRIAGWTAATLLASGLTYPAGITDEDGPVAVAAPVTSKAWAVDKGIIGAAKVALAVVRTWTENGATPAASQSPTPSATKTPKRPKKDTFESCVAKKMSVEEKVGQTLAPGIFGAELKVAAKTLDKHSVGTVLVYEPEDLSDVEFVKKKLKIRPLMAIDAEGGSVNRIPAIDKLPSAQEVAETYADNPKDATKLYADTGKKYSELGFDLVYSTVVDINRGPDTLRDPSRTFSDDVDTIVKFADVQATGWEKANIIPTYKHAFGMKDNTDFDVAETYPLDELYKKDLVPYEDLDASRVLMVGSGAVDGLEPKGLPASQNPAAVQDILRDEMGFEGVIASDDLAAPGLGGKPLKKAVTDFLIAGGDQAVFKVPYEDSAEETLTEVQDYVVDQVGESLPKERLDEAAGRMITLKNLNAKELGLEEIDPCKL